MNEINNNSKKTAKNEFQLLRTEIIGSQKARMEFLQYKLIAVASLAAIGLGFTGYQTGNPPNMFADYVLCIIPFVCVYIDLLCYHNTIRIFVIACFLNHNDDSYEGYIVKLGNDNEKSGARNLFKMEDYALYWSSMGLSFLLAIYSLIYLLKEEPLRKGWIFLFAGILGIIINEFIKGSFAVRRQALFSKAAELKTLLNAS